jgi:hypothetical protein
MFHMPHLRVLTLSHNRLPSTCIPEFIDESAHPVQLQVCLVSSLLPVCVRVTAVV